MSCNQLLIDSAMYLLTINSPTLKSVAMSLYVIILMYVRMTLESDILISLGPRSIRWSWSRSVLWAGELSLSTYALSEAHSMREWTTMPGQVITKLQQVCTRCTDGAEVMPQLRIHLWKLKISKLALNDVSSMFSSIQCLCQTAHNSSGVTSRKWSRATCDKHKTLKITCSVYNFHAPCQQCVLT